MTRYSDRRRLELLGSAGTAMALLVAGSTIGAPIAAAATVDTVTATATGDKTAVSQISNNADVSATIAGSSGGVQTDASSGTSTTNTASGNDILAGATGNAFHNQIDLATVEATAGTGGGAAMGISTNASGANISALATANNIAVDLTDFSSGSATNDGNTISATAKANDGSTLLSGPIGSDFSSSIIGTANASRALLGTTASIASGSLIAATRQTSIDPANTATAAGNTIDTRIDSTVDNTVTASPSVSGNTITAKVGGNASQSTISIAADDTPQYDGSAIVSNLQDSMGAGLSTANNIGSTISGDVYTSGLPVNTLTGGLAVEGNTISSSASNNVALGSGVGQAGNEILLDDALSFNGGGAPVATFGVTRAGSDYAAASSADMGVQNVQTAMGLDIDARLGISAQTQVGLISGRAEALANGSVSVSGNNMTATAQSNAASSRIANGDNAAGFAGTVAVGNLQDNNMVDVTASNVSGAIQGVVEEGFTSSTVKSANNAVRATAYGNQVSQSANLEATSLAIGTGEAALTSNPVGGSMGAAGAVVVGNVQANTDTAVTAGQSSNISVNWLSPTDSSMIGSSLTATGNTQEAIALGSSAGNTLSLSGTTVGTGAGIANLQSADAASSVEANSTGQVASFAGDTITDSEATVSNNLQRAIGYGASSGNTLNVAANALTLAPTASINPSITGTVNLASPEAATSLVQSAYGLSNRQAQAGDVSANAVATTAFENRVEGNVANSGTLQTDGNSFVAAAYGNDTANAISVDSNAIDTGVGGYAAVAGLANVQSVAGADILARAAGEDVVLTYVDNDTSNASVSTSENTVQALAYSNRATANAVTANATNIDTAVDGTPLRGSVSYNAVTSTAAVDASFAAQNVQASSGSVTASLLTAGVDPDSARIRTQIDDDIFDSTIASDANMSIAGATGNRAATSVALDANQIASTAGVQNIQITSSDLAALIGIAGTPGSPAIPGTPDTPITASGTSAAGTMSLSGDTLTVAGGSVTVTFAGSSFTADEAAYLNGLTGISGATTGGNSVTFAAGTIDTATFNNFVFNSGADGSSSGDESFTVTSFTIPGTPATPAVLATPNQGGVTVAIGDDVINSSVSVAGNSTAGSVLGSSATNALIASATEISGGSGQVSSTATNLSAVADLALSNFQSDNAATEASTVYGTFAIDATAGDVNESSLAVSNNSQRSDAGSNLAANTVSVSATNLSAGSALSSYQDSAADVSATSALDIFAPGASTQSSTEMNANTNTARAVVNEANNSVQVAATNVAPVSAPNLVTNPAALTLVADHVLVSAQAATGSANSTASSQIFNGDAAELTTNGLSSGSIEIADNATTAQSVANLASNVMSVDGSANQGASAGVNNYQLSGAVVSANATSSATVTLAGDALALPTGAAAADDATVRIADNSTTAAARGNSASNVLNMDAGATYGTAGVGTPGVGFGIGGSTTSFAATGGVLNQQNNLGAVSATSTGATYRVALNGLAGSPTVTGSSASVAGNAVNAEAYGNTASNRITMTALNTGTPSAAIGNYQTNSGGVTATVTSVNYGIAAGVGVIGGSTFSATGNQVAATAVGNNAVSIISAGN